VSLLRRAAILASASSSLLVSQTAGAEPGVPSGAAMVRVLGDGATAIFAPSTGRIGALVRIPEGTTASSLGVDELVPGVGRLRTDPRGIAAFAAAHPGVDLEVSPPLHMLLDKAGVFTNAALARLVDAVDGTGVLVGVADVGLDVTHPDFLDASGKSRVAWLLDLSLPPRGFHPELEQKFGLKDANGNVVAGAVFTGSDIDTLRAAQDKSLPQDEVGHGTHVSSIACGNGGLNPHTSYIGMAPNAQIVFARVAGAGGGDAIEDDAALDGVAFLFDRADAMHLPIAVNFSLGKDFGPHDGSTMWEQSLASFVGPDHPGHAFVVAAGNSGDIVGSAVHQNVYVSDGTRMRVPVLTDGAQAGGVQIWVSMRAGASLAVGLEAPNGEWIAPVPNGSETGYNQSGVNAGVINGDSASQSPIPQGSHGAVVIWNGTWPSGTYYVTLEGSGTADLFLQSSGDASLPGLTNVGFAGGVREGTVDLPATHPSIIAVGCTVSKPSWTSEAGGTVRFVVPELDPAGGLPDPQGKLRSLVNGEVCYFSGAGPTLTGVPKPEISAPGAVVAAAMSQQATPGTLGSIFTNPECPPPKQGGAPDPHCMQVDSTHAVNAGTSMSSPMVAGAVALLFQRDPTLTQDKIAMLLQAGAHPFRSPVPFEDQGGPGELDVLGSLDALAQSNGTTTLLPSAGTSWMTLSADYAAADGSTPLTAIVELRTADGQHRADVFDSSRLALYVEIDGQVIGAPALTRHGPGVWYGAITIEPGHGGSAMTVGATFDGAEIVQPRTVPIATDVWTARYPPSVGGGCATAPGATGDALWVGALLPLVARRWRRRSR
jgi:hypothetical protein